MLTNDFTGAYDYEKEEAEHAARYILDDLNDANISPEELAERLQKERAHWKKCLSDTFDDWNKHFQNAINAGLTQALKGYEINSAQ